MRIVNLEFDFEAVFVAPDDQYALVLVVEVPTLDDSALDTLRRRLDRLSLALTRAESLRPVTLVLVTPKASPRALDAIRPLARIVVVSQVDQSEDDLTNALREFRPLLSVAPASSEAVSDALTRHLGAATADPEVKSLRRAAARETKAAKAVEDAFAVLLAAAIAGPAPAIP